MTPTPDDKLREVGVYASQFANFAQRVKMKFWDVTTTSTISDELLNEILLLAFADFTKLLTAERTRVEEEIEGLETYNAVDITRNSGVNMVMEGAVNKNAVLAILKGDNKIK